MNKKKLKIARKKIDQLDKEIFVLIKKRTQVIKYMLSLKKFKKEIINYRRINEILKKMSSFLLIGLGEFNYSFFPS